MIKRGLTLLVCGVLLLVPFAAPGVASASTQFVAQARAAGLSSSEADWMQRMASWYVVKAEGKQTSPNTVDLPDGGRVQIALPGEQYPRDFSRADGTLASQCNGGTARGYVCVYSGYRGTGTSIAGYYCGYGNSIYMNPEIFWNSGQGSWGSNQSSGARGLFWTIGGRIADYIPDQGYNHYYEWADRQITEFVTCGV